MKMKEMSHGLRARCVCQRMWKWLNSAMFWVLSTDAMTAAAGTLQMEEPLVQSTKTGYTMIQIQGSSIKCRNQGLLLIRSEKTREK